MPVGVHTYLKNATEDPTPHLAAFQIFRQEHWYSFSSTGWLDADWHWSPLYDELGACGKPLGNATGAPAPTVYTRDFEHCSFVLNCTVPGACTAAWSKPKSKV